MKIPLTVYEVLTLIYILNASKINADYNIMETGALLWLDSNNIIDFPKIQICTNINKQHLNFLRKNFKRGDKRGCCISQSFYENLYSQTNSICFKKIKSHLKIT